MTGTGVDRQTAAVFEYAGGQQALVDCALDMAGNNRAAIIGTAGWVEIDSVWYNPVPFTRYDIQGNVVERFDQPVKSRGMQYQAAELERLVREGATSGSLLPPGESVAIMAAMDEIRRQVGLAYDADRQL